MKRNILKYIFIFVSIMFLVGCGNNTGSGIIDGNSKIKIVKNEVSNIKLEEYSSDVFSMKKQVGWKVEPGGEGIYYAIRVYDEVLTFTYEYVILKDYTMIPIDDVMTNRGKTYNYNFYVDRFEEVKDTFVE